MQPTPEEKKKIDKWALIIIAILLVVGTIQHQYALRNPSKPQYVKLQASIQYNGLQISITNKDNFDWSNIGLALNMQNPNINHYRYQVPLIRSNETYTVGLVNFANDDGARFNPYAYKVQDVYIDCYTPNGEGLYDGLFFQ